MCGRTANSMSRDQIINALNFRNKRGLRQKPRWRDPPGGQHYNPSTNIAPGTHMPILVSKRQLPSRVAPKVQESNAEEPTVETECEEADDLIVQPMRWGLIPHWHSGDIKNVGYNTINARSDTLLTKPAFKHPLEKGRRCVILVEGYFEWQKTKDGNKQPYFVYTPRSTATTVEEVKEEQDQPVEEGGGDSKKLLMLAGMFNIYIPKNNEPPVYSCTVITVNAHKSMEWLHERMPAILETEEEVQAWLDSGSTPIAKAMELIRPVAKVQYHPVSKDVGNVKNKGEHLLEEVDPSKFKQTAESSFMSAWLKPKKRLSTSLEEGPPKKKSTLKESDKKEMANA